MRITALASLFAVAVGILQGQPNVDTGPPKKPGSVEGTVVNSVSHEPLKKATVLLRNIRERYSYTIVSDAAGHFLFDNVEPGTYQVSVDRDGFTAPPQRRRSALDSKPITVDEQQHVKNVTTQLMPLGIVSGRVLDEDGDPMPDANVQAVRFSYSMGGRRLSPWRSANTNDLGEFQLINLEPARYYFRVTVQRRMFLPAHTRGAHAQQAYPAVYYPNASEVAQATSQEVTAGSQLTGIDFRLHQTSAYRVSGKVIDGQTGQAAHNVFVQIQTRDLAFGMGNGSAQVQQDGTFEIRGVVGGSYIATAQRNDGEIRMSARQPVNVTDQDVDDLLLTLRSGFEVSGAITVDGVPATPPQNGRRNTPTNRPPQVQLQPLEQRGRSAQAIVESDGTFVLRDVSPEAYVLSINPGMPGTYVKSIRFGDQEVPSGQIDLSQQSGAPINIMLGTDGGQIQGIVQDRSGKPAPGVMIFAAPREEYANRRDLVKQTSSDQNGSFQLRDVAPGQYKLFAWEDSDIVMVTAPEFRKLFESKAASVNVGTNGKESVQLNLISSEEMESEKSKLP